jgi:hypothetical protein
MNSALKYKLQAPLVDALLRSAGMESKGLTDLLSPAAAEPAVPDGASSPE